MSDRDAYARRLVALMSADVEGYSRLMAYDDTATVRTLTAYRDVIAALVRERRGRIVDSPGDNVLAEFGSVVDAAECAVAIQRALRARNADVPAERRMLFRIGINLGEVIVDGERLYGDGVNVAARLESLAEPGGIAVSGSAWEQLLGKVPYRFDALGERSMKNIARAVRVYRLAFDEPESLPRSAAPPAPAHGASVAVLPFSDYDASDGRSYFADGVVEDVVGALASLPDLLVISRHSTAAFRDAARDVRLVGEKLGVRYMVTGSVQRRAGAVRIMTELCDTETSAVLWSDRLGGPVDDVFALHDRLFERIVTTIAPHVRQAELRRALTKRPESLSAYEFVLRGLDLLYRLRQAEFEQAREMFQRAIDLEPSYATPYALSAIWHSVRIGQGWAADRTREFEEIARLATAAVERDPLDARALAMCGHVRALLFRDYDAAFALFDRALAASPNSPDAWVRSSPTFSYVGDGREARRRAEQALRLSPFDPHVFYTQTALALAHYTLGDFAEAVAWGRKAMLANPLYTPTLRMLAASLGAVGRIDEAQSVGRALLTQVPAFRVGPFCDGYAFADSARRAALASHLRAAGLPE